MNKEILAKSLLNKIKLVAKRNFKDIFSSILRKYFSPYLVKISDIFESSVSSIFLSISINIKFQLMDLTGKNLRKN